MKAVTILAIAVSLVMVLLMLTPTFAVNGPLAQQLQYKFYDGQSSLFNALLNGDIDFMAWPLTYAQYQACIGNPDIQVAAYSELGDYEIAFNNNMTDPSHRADRKPMNYTEFRQAISCLVDKDGLIAGPNVNGFGTRIDTQIARPAQNAWVNFNISKYDSNGNLINNYPWDYNETHALEILWTNGWYSHSTYPTLASLLTAFAGGPLPTGSVVYPLGHPRAGTAIDSIWGYIRGDHPPRKEAGESLVAEMQKLGISVIWNEGGASVQYTQVFIERDYDFYTAGWSFGRFPLQFCHLFIPDQYYSPLLTGPDLYMVFDQNMTDHSILEYPNATSPEMSMNEAYICQDIIVKKAFMVPLYTPASYIAYRTGALGLINFRGYGLTTALDFAFMNTKTAPYSSPMTIKYGTLNPPEQINPIFSSWLWDYEVADRIFAGPMAINPYNPTVPLKSPAGGDLPWMAYDWKWQLSNFTGGGGQGDPSDSYMNMANVTFWFRHDITWQDGVPFTVDDFNYTIYINKAYDGSWAQMDMFFIVNFVKWDDWTCSLYFWTPSYYALYMANYNIVPEHIYKYIAISGYAYYGTGHYGYWPGADATADEILPGAPFTYSQLTSAGGEQYTWIDTGMWKYVPGTLVQGAGGGLSCVPYSGFWTQLTVGEVDFKYSWNPGIAPQGGSYVVGLSDLVVMANAYGTSGNAPVPFLFGSLHVWEPGCDLAAPAGTVGLSDLVTMALNYGQHWGANP